MIHATDRRLRGVMMWDTNWDRLNKFEVSNAACDAMGL